MPSAWVAFWVDNVCAGLQEAKGMQLAFIQSMKEYRGDRGVSIRMQKLQHGFHCWDFDLLCKWNRLGDDVQQGLRKQFGIVWRLLHYELTHTWWPQHIARKDRVWQFDVPWDEYHVFAARIEAEWHRQLGTNGRWVKPISHLVVPVMR